MTFLRFIFGNFKLSRFITQVLFYVGLSLCAIFNLTFINILISLILIATLYFLVVEPATILNMKDDLNEVISIAETFLTPFLQTCMIITLYITQHTGLLMLFVLVEAVYFCIRKMRQQGQLS